MRGSQRGRGGTETARPLDIGRVGKALAQPGMDVRHWASYGTVCTLNEDGTLDYGDGGAIYVSPDGCFVDVLLSPTNQHVTCRYPGAAGASVGTIYAQIRPGDEVLVVIPDGDLSYPPVIAAVMNAEHTRLPMNPNRTATWQNDRVLVHGGSQKVQVMATGGAEVDVNPDGSTNVTGSAVTLGQPTATEQLVLGTTYRGEEATLDQSIIALLGDPLGGLATLAAAIDATELTGFTGTYPTIGAFIGACKVQLPLWLSAIQAFEAQAGQYLSDTTKTT